MLTSVKTGHLDETERLVDAVGQIAPAAPRFCHGIHRVDDHRRTRRQGFLGEHVSDDIGGETGRLIARDSGASQRSLDCVDTNVCGAQLPRDATGEGCLADSR
jgi:hypothetical protein